MKKIYVFVLIIFLAISVYSFYAYNNEKDIEQDKEITVILAVNSNIVKTDSKVLKGYESVLQEEGVAYRIIDVYNLQHLQPAEILKIAQLLFFQTGSLRICRKKLQCGCMTTWNKVVTA